MKRKKEHCEDIKQGVESVIQQNTPFRIVFLEISVEAAYFCSG